MACLYCLPPVLEGHLEHNHSSKTKDSLSSTIKPMFISEINVSSTFEWVLCTFRSQLWHKLAFVIVVNSTSMWNLFLAVVPRGWPFKTGMASGDVFYFQIEVANILQSNASGPKGLPYPHEEGHFWGRRFEKWDGFGDSCLQVLKWILGANWSISTFTKEAKERYQPWKEVLNERLETTVNFVLVVHFHNVKCFWRECLYGSFKALFITPFKCHEKWLSHVRE